MPRNFLFISLDNLSGDVAWQLSKENNVKYYQKNQDEDLDVANGFIEKVSNYEEFLDWADVIIFDDTLGQGKLADELRKKGKLVVGGTVYSDRLEDDRSFGQEQLKAAGVNILPYKDFISFNEAIQFVKDNPCAYVIKPTGEIEASTKGILFIGEQAKGEDVIQVLNDYKDAWAESILKFQLQKKISGIEVAVGAFYDGHRFINPINVNFEHKKLFNGDIGPNTGEMGTSMFWSSPNKMFNDTLKKMEKRLKGYVGYMDLNCIVNEEGIFPLEFTSRFGYPTIFIQMDGIISPLGEFFYELAAGNNPKLEVKPGFQVGVRIVVPPFPFNDKETFNVKSKGSVIYFKKNKEGAHIEDVKLVRNKWIVAGTSGVVLTVCGTGISMKDAQSQAYSRINNINIPRMYYRTDIGDRWYEDGDKLHSWGYLRS
ncbi:MAG: phosphoribosylglycinamide synthetase C domain-containing protein [archaeon]